MKQLFNLKSYIIFLSRNKVYTAINVFGLSISLMFVLLIGIYTWQEYSVNKQFPKADRIFVYAVEAHGNKFSGGHWKLQEHFRSRYPEIESSCALGGTGEVGYIMKDGDRKQYKTTFTDSTFFDIFDIPFVCGSKRQALADRLSAVVSEEFANSLFGSPEKALGQQLNMEDTLRFRISGVIPKIMNSSLPSSDIYIRYENVGLFNPALTSDGLNNATGAEVIFLAKPNTDLLSKVKDMNAFQKQFFWFFQLKDTNIKSFFIPFNKYYFAGISSSSGTLKTGDGKLVKILFVVGLVILLFAIFNYINLTTAQSNRRAREMATRRLMGAQRKGVIGKLIIESCVLCLISMLVAILLVYVVTPYVGKLLNTELQLAWLIHPVSILLNIVFILIVALLAGLIPATIISRARPIDIVRGTFRLAHKHTFSKMFIIVQNTITIVLIAATFTMSHQIHHMITLSRGFNTTGLIEVPVSMSDKTLMERWFNQLQRLTSVKNVTACAGTPYSGGNNETFDLNNKTISKQELIGDKEYMKIFGLGLERADATDKKEKVYVNKQMLAEEGLPANSRYYYSGKERIPIDGILKDFHIRGLESLQHPLCLRILDRKDFRSWSTVIQIQGNPVIAYQDVQRVFEEVFKTPLELDNPYIDQQIAAEYQSETRIATIVQLFSFIAILISLLGLIAMSTYFIQQRSKEIAVRKVFGSTSNQIRHGLIRTFLHYVLIAFAISVPTIWYFMSSWISQYTYRITWWPWIIVAGIIVLIISFSAVAVQSYMASNENPVKHIKDNQ